MSKAFTKDEGEGSGEALVRPLGPPLPEGAKNYATPSGAAELRRKHAEAQGQLEHARAAGNADAAAQAQETFRFYAERLAALEEVPPPRNAEERVRFGASVRTADAEGNEREVHIVGVDEADPARGAVSWNSPLARALLGHRAGDEVQVRTPQGLLELEIVSVSYG